VRYEVVTKSGQRTRNVEYFRFENGHVRRIDVYYGSLSKSALPETHLPELALY
jgi:hypothetical protein